MQSLLADDLYWVRRRLPGPVVKLMRHHAGKAVIAGGYIRSCVSNELINDIDIFAPTSAEARDWAYELSRNYNLKLGQGKTRVHTSQNAYTVIGVKPSVQIIHRWTYAKPEDIIGSFDFTIARSAMWWEPGEVRLPPKTRRQKRGAKSRAHRWRTMVDDRFYADLAARRLVYCSPVRNEDAGGSLLRVLKFYQRGFRIPLPSLGAVIARLGMAVDWEECQRGTKQETEEQFAKVFSGLLREVDPSVDPDHIMHLPTADEVEDDEEDQDEGIEGGDSEAEGQGDSA